ncbi:MAG: MATE family efflux transporter [Clostridiales bacterium]|nr:MATE family efflux transporter [Clostridiales bacterium]
MANHGKAVDTKEIFENMPVAKALATLAIPTILSQLISLVYNMADTYFIGTTDDPNKVAASSLAYMLVFFQMSISNLFAIGGGSLISRLLGMKNDRDARSVAALSFYGSICITLIYITIIWTNIDKLLVMMGASENTIGYARSYAFWVAVVGGIPATLNTTMAQMLRSVGYAKVSSFGLSMGGVINVILDPIFMFVILPSGHEVTGAAMATAFSNTVATLYLLYKIMLLRKTTVLSILPKDAGPGMKYIGEIFAVGFPSCISALSNSLSGTIRNNLSAGYGDVSLAAMGIVGKIDSIPLSLSMGLCQGMMPLVAYNYAAKNYKRMKEAANTARTWSMIFAVVCIIAFEIFTETVFSIFMDEPETLTIGIKLLRICCLATPLMIANVQMNYMFQAMGKGKESLFLAICRRGLTNIPFLFIMNYFFGLFGIAWTQAASDSVTLIISFAMYRRLLKGLNIEETSEELKE